MVFPPASAPDRAHLSIDGSIRLDDHWVESLYESIWFLHPNHELAASVTRWTFEVATTRSDRLPTSDLMHAWLLTIADRELRRVHAVRGQERGALLPADTSDRHDLAHRLADVLQPLSHQQRLALVLRYRLDQKPAAVSAALGMGIPEAERLIKRAARRAAKNAETPISSLAVAEPPSATGLPREVTPLDQQPGRNRLDYRWQADGFPTETAYDGAGRKWALVAVTAALIAAGMIGLSNRPEDNRPRIVDEPAPTTTTIPDESSSSPLPPMSPDQPLT
ncbi:MAG: hypothetical protein ACR2QE_13395 [Acidimicrobiales bacterium]